eukprot:Gb_07794 [translate_table: standard]
MGCVNGVLADEPLDIETELPQFSINLKSVAEHDEKQVEDLTMSTLKMLDDDSVKVLQHNLFTNDVFYTAIPFDMRPLRPDLLPLVPLFCQSLLDDQCVVNPTIKQVEEPKFNLLLAGTADAILLIEGYNDFLTKELLLQAVNIRQGAVRTICKEVEIFFNTSGKNKMDEAIRLPPPKLYEQVKELVEGGLIKALQCQSKKPQMKAISSLGGRVLTVLIEDGHLKENGIIRSYEAVEEDELMVANGEVEEGWKKQRWASCNNDTKRLQGWLEDNGQDGCAPKIAALDFLHMGHMSKEMSVSHRISKDHSKSGSIQLLGRLEKAFESS